MQEFTPEGKGIEKNTRQPAIHGNLAQDSRHEKRETENRSIIVYSKDSSETFHNFDPIKRRIMEKNLCYFSPKKQPEQIIYQEIACSICQDDIREDEKVLQLLGGKTHLFHFSCLKEWIQFKQEGPTCRTNLQDLYESKILEEAYQSKIFTQDDQYLYAEDIILLRRAQESVFEQLFRFGDDQIKD